MTETPHTTQTHDTNEYAKGLSQGEREVLEGIAKREAERAEKMERLGKAVVVTNEQGVVMLPDEELADRDPETTRERVSNR